MDEKTVLNQLIAMSRSLGDPKNDYVILGEGNTSAKIDDEHFFVKASGTYLSTASEETFVKVKSKDALAVLDAGELSDDKIKEALQAACADPDDKRRPSVETTFHSFFLSLPDVNFVGHTHATAVNAIMCSKNAKDIIRGRICPDEIVYCGVEPIYIDFVDPGLTLARTIRERTYKYIDKHNCNPKVILMQNHGVVALGKTAQEVEAITAMECKTARILAGTYVFGGPRYFTKENVDRIYSRPDEDYRRQQFK